ncbi:hypothetical protein AB4510_03260 [Vibrio sp. 10N.222.54.B12]|uniref:hypothetical protein n=1 Tax=Vibrio sp. 10N.222.54.B12 TaxID=3229636 RepID=UPI00355232DE
MKVLYKLRAAAIYAGLALGIGSIMGTYVFKEYKYTNFAQSRSHYDATKDVVAWKNSTLLPSRENIKSFDFDSIKQRKFNSNLRSTPIEWDSFKTGGVAGTTMREDLIKQVESDADAMIAFIKLLHAVDMKYRLDGVIDVDKLHNSYTYLVFEELESYLPYVSAPVAAIIGTPLESISAFHTQTTSRGIDVSKYFLYRTGEPRTYFHNYYDTINYYSAYKEYWVKYMIKNTHHVSRLHVPRHHFRFVGKNWYKY